MKLPGWCSTPPQLLICSSFNRENGHPLLICSSLSTAQFQITWKTRKKQPRDDPEKITENTILLGENHPVFDWNLFLLPPAFPFTKWSCFRFLIFTHRTVRCNQLPTTTPTGLGVPYSPVVKNRQSWSLGTKICLIFLRTFESSIFLGVSILLRLLPPRRVEEEWQSSNFFYSNFWWRAFREVGKLDHEG